MYYGMLLILWNFSNALAIPILGLNNENKYYNPNHQYNISWDYDQLNKPVMTLQNLYDFKMTSIWAFLIGMLAAFGFICIFWIIIYKGMSTNNEDKLKPQKSEKKCSCFNCFKGKPQQLKECPAQRHKYPLFSFKRSPKSITQNLM